VSELILPLKRTVLPLYYASQTQSVLATKYVLTAATSSTYCHRLAESQLRTTISPKNCFLRTTLGRKYPTPGSTFGILSDSSCGRGSYRPAQPRQLIILLFFPNILNGQPVRVYLEFYISRFQELERERERLRVASRWCNIATDEKGTVMNDAVMGLGLWYL
jgi:hypothetical protein